MANNHAGHRGHNPSSLSDILASFPNPSVSTPDRRSSWPVFFGRSNLCNVESLPSHDDGPENQEKPPRRCCGMPRRWFILLCILLFIIVVLAVLLPVFLVAVPREKASSNSCANTTPCRNGGASVSSGTECSCVCANGYSGSQCTIAGDSSCVTSEVDYGNIRKNATMGSSLPTLFTQSEQKFNISLDPVTLMALFSLNNISCTTQNELVSFSDLEGSSSDKTRRSVNLPLDSGHLAEAETNNSPSLSVGTSDPSPVVVARSVATTNGILYDSATPSATRAASSESGDATITSVPTKINSQDATTTASSSTSTATATATSSPDEVVEFSQIAVLFILQKTGSFDSAQASESKIQSYLNDYYSSTSHPSLELLGLFDLDFENKTITSEQGTK